MKTLKEFYEEKNKEAHIWPNMIYAFSKPKYREPLDKKGHETLQKFIKQIYNPRLRKLKEAEYFREEWLEPEISEAKSQV